MEESDSRMMAHLLTPAARREQIELLLALKFGTEKWYERYVLRTAKVEHEHRFHF